MQIAETLETARTGAFPSSRPQQRDLHETSRGSAAWLLPLILSGAAIWALAIAWMASLLS
jgi:hypothetical protein